MAQSKMKDFEEIILDLDTQNLELARDHAQKCLRKNPNGQGWGFRSRIKKIEAELARRQKNGAAS